MLKPKTCPPHKPVVMTDEEYAFGASEPWRSGETWYCERCGADLPKPEVAHG